MKYAGLDQMNKQMWTNRQCSNRTGGILCSVAISTKYTKCLTRGSPGKKKDRLNMSSVAEQTGEKFGCEDG